MQEHVSHLICDDPFGEAVLYVHSVFGPSSILRSLWVPLQIRVPVRCLNHYSQEHMVVCSLVTAKGVRTSGGKTIKFTYLIKAAKF